MSKKYVMYNEYKNSGVEWLGDVPKKWEIKKLKFICDTKTGTRNTEDAVPEGKYPFFVRSQTVEKINSFGANCEAILTAGDGVGVGKVYHYYSGKFDFHQRVYMLSNFRYVLGRFVYYYLFCNFYKVALDGNAKSTVDSLRLPQFLNFEFSLPDLQSQDHIISFLDHETRKIDALISKQKRLIELLKEKRQAVISRAVTKGLNPDVPMKDSGVEWLGDIPQHWRITRVKFESYVKARVGWHGLKSDDFTDEGPYLVTGSDFKGPKIKWENCYHCDIERYKQDPYIQLVEGDLLLTKDGTIGKVALVSGLKGKATLNSGVFVVRPLEDNYISQFYFWLIQSSVFKGFVDFNKTGSTIVHLYQDTFINFKFALPNLNEQKNIVQYLNQKSKSFDKLILKVESAITLMQERRTALISAAVTGKIDVRDWQAPKETKNIEEQAA